MLFEILSYAELSGNKFLLDNDRSHDMTKVCAICTTSVEKLETCPLCGEVS